MTLDELPGYWDQESATCDEIAKVTHSLDVRVRAVARAECLRQCAYQLRLVTGNARRNAAGEAAATPSSPPEGSNQ